MVLSYVYINILFIDTGLVILLMEYRLYMSTKVQESEIFERLCIVVSNQLSVSVDKVALESTFADLGADSLDTVELVMAIEEEFGIEIPDDDAAKMSNLGDAVKYINNQGI